MHTLARPRSRGGPTPPGAAPPGRRRRTLLLAHELRALGGVAGPLIVSQLGGIAMTTADTIMVGPLGAQALAAAGLGNALYVFALMVCTGTLLGMSPLVSQAYGAGERAECRRVLVQGLWVAALMAGPLSIWLLLGEPLGRALGQTPEVVALAGDYLRALAWGIPPMLLFYALRQYLDAMGITRPAMLVTFLGLAVNILGNLVLIYGVEARVPLLGRIHVPAYGLVGSGWATTTVRWAMLAAMATYVLRRPELTPLRGTPLRPNAAQLRRIVAIGLPVGGQTAAEVGVFAFAAVMMGWLGPLRQAAHQVTINIAATTFMVAMGTSIAGSIRVGHHVGAGNVRGARRATLATYALVTAFMSLTALLFLALPAPLLGLYTRDGEIVRIGTGLLLMAAAFQLFDGAQVAGISVLRGAGDTRVPMVITILSYWAVGAPVAYLLGFHTSLGARGIWLGLVVSLAVAAVLLAWRVRRVVWEQPLRRV